MPRKTSKRRTRGDTRTVSAPTKPGATRPAVTQPDRQNLRTQVRGGRPPRFPGRTGGR